MTLWFGMRYKTYSHGQDSSATSAINVRMTLPWATLVRDRYTLRAVIDLTWNTQPHDQHRAALVYVNQSQGQLQSASYGDSDITYIGRTESRPGPDVRVTLARANPHWVIMHTVFPRMAIPKKNPESRNPFHPVQQSECPICVNRVQDKYILLFCVKGIYLAFSHASTQFYPYMTFTISHFSYIYIDLYKKFSLQHQTALIITCIFTNLHRRARF